MELKGEFLEKASKVELLVMDCDGVLTDGRLYFGQTGEELKVFHARDGQGLVEWHRAGYRSAIISGRKSPIVEMRARQLGVEFVIQGRNDKGVAFAELLEMASVESSATAFVGDDTPDSAAFPFVGLSFAVADAHKSVKATADIVTDSNGGRGAVREVIDLLMESKRKASHGE